FAIFSIAITGYWPCNVQFTVQ
ncbi:hypothetical protein A2U01_0108096, partial [Trifolium medium]|nr:hypothetical protein [Trifolium medium]